MALPAPKTFVQDMPPRGGFPSVEYKRPRITRGPHGAIVLLGAAAITAFGIWRHIGEKKDQRYAEMHQFAQRYERAYLIQAKGRITTEREKARILDAERDAMKHVPGWVAGQNPYFTQPQIPRIVFKPNFPEA